MILGAYGLKVLNDKQIQQIIDASFKILEHTGVLVENDEILKKLGEFGGRVDLDKQRVCFSRQFIEDYMSGIKKVSWEDKPVRFTASAEIYEGYFLDPVDGQFKAWNHEHFFNYVKVAKELKNLSGIVMLGCPLTDLQPGLQPLYEKLYCWKYGIYGGSAIWDTELCPQIYDMWTIYADERKKDIGELFNGTVYLISPLKFAYVEAQQFMYFYKRGLRVNVGASGALGSSYPVTLAGAIALHLAENIFISILDTAFFGTNTMSLYSSIAVLDMSRGAFQYGRPEKSIVNIAFSQIARYLGLNYSGHTGLSDAKVPGHEAGVQKVVSAIFTASSSGIGNIAAGLLGVDQIFSPVQLILDDEITGALNRICEGMEVNDETLALDVINEIGPGGNFLATDHTLMNFRKTLWQPVTWSREMYNIWDMNGRKNDIDKAKDMYLSIIYDGKVLESQISEETEKKLLDIIKRCIK